MDLDAEAPAHVRRDDTDTMFFQAEDGREHGLHHVGDLGGDPQGQAARGRFEMGQERAGLDGDTGVAAEVERLAEDVVGLAEGRLHVAPLEGGVEDPVVLQLVVDAGGARAQGRLSIQQGREDLVLHFHELAGVLGHGAGEGGHGHHGFAHVADAVQGQGVLRAGPHTLVVVEDAAPGGATAGRLRPGEHGHHPGVPAGPLRIHSHEAGVGVGAADEGDLHHPRQMHVVHVGAVAREDPRVLHAVHRPADPLATGPGS
jgi:hypothetical protein